MIFVQCHGIIPLKKVEGVWQVLLILHCKGSYWSFPKGHEEEGEIPQTTAERELKEETGLDIAEWLSLVPFEERYSFFRGQDEIYKKVSYFPALVTGEVRIQKEEIAQAKWVELAHAKEQLQFAAGRAICDQVIAFLDGK